MADEMIYPGSFGFQAERLLPYLDPKKVANKITEHHSHATAEKYEQWNTILMLACDLLEPMPQNWQEASNIPWDSVLRELGLSWAELFCADSRIFEAHNAFENESYVLLFPHLPWEYSEYNPSSKEDCVQKMFLMMKMFLAEGESIDLIQSIVQDF